MYSTVFIQQRNIYDNAEFQHKLATIQIPKETQS
jgi:hypothetical protein